MFNTDSLAWKWHIPELARQIYPWVSWLYQEYYGLAGAFLVIGLFFGLAELWAGRMRFVGLSHKERREYADRYKRDNKRPAPFSVLASLDSPGRMVRARRHVWNYAYWLTGAAGLALLGGLVVAVFIESWGETVLRPDLYANADYYLLQPANLFGIAWCAGGLAVGIVLARLLAFLLLDGHFAAADEAVNAKLNQESRRSSQRTGEMTDVRHLHFGEPVPVNALADFSSEQARQEQAVFLGKDEQGKP
ncbi:Mobilization protein A, partial [Klebsiella pneumoniae]|nr:Mobilization protein A [Klebsiella pneumoniae]MCA0076903.1 Mobilization protein A [Klebsiella pneumoniae]